MDAPHLEGGRFPAPAAGDLVPVSRRIVTWVDGSPVVKDVPLFTPAQINDIGAAALAELYAEPDDALAIELGLPPSEFYGRPLAEVMLVRQARSAAKTGAKDEVEAIMDRRLGKPKQSIESHKIVESYEDALRRIARDEDQQRLARARPVFTEAALIDSVDSEADPLEGL